MKPILLENARLLDPASGLDAVGGLLIVDGLIADIGPAVAAAPAGAETVDCTGLCLAPGLVDMRVQTCEPGDEHMETLTTASQAAVAGGVTTFACLPDTNPVIDDVALLEYVERRGNEVGLVNVHSYAAATKRLKGEVMTELGLLHQAGAVGFTDGHKAIANALVMRRILAYSKLFDTVVVQHPELPDLVGSGVMNEGETATRLGLSGIPAAAEVIMVERDLRLVELTGGRYHASCISTGAAIEAIRQAKRRGLPVTCDTAPPYFALNEGAVTGYRTFAKISPPLRAEADRLAVVAGLADGTIDAIASDHTPRDQDSKRLPFAQAEDGAVGLETLLPVSLELVHNGQMSLLAVLNALTVNPAGILRLKAGRLATGGPADLFLFDPARADRIVGDRLRSKSKNTPFDGRPIQGRVVKTYKGGRLVFDAEAEEARLRGRTSHA